MYILGIHAFSHDAGACLITNDGICGLAEERLTRIKYAGGFPEKSINYVLKYFGIKSINKINLVVYDRLGIIKDKDDTINCLRNLGYKGEIIGIDHHDAHAASAFFYEPL